MKSDETNDESSFSSRIKEQETRKVKAQGADTESPWLGLGMFGMVGWSVVVPSVLGALLGFWLDHHHPVPFSWTLSLLVVGLIIGCVMAWYWVVKEEKDIHT
jgi:ATP synthase protein I